MAQYIDYDTDEDNGRVFSVAAANIEIQRVGGGAGNVMIADKVENFPELETPFADLQEATDAYNSLIFAMKACGVMYEDD